MAVIKVSTEVLEDGQQQMLNIVRKLQSVSERVQNVNASLNWKVAVAAQLAGNLSQQSAKINSMGDTVSSLAEVLSTASAQYKKAESDCCGYAEGETVDATSASSSGSASDTEEELSFGDRFRDWANDTWDEIKTGAAKVVDWAQDTVAYWVDDWNAKGWTYKTVHTVIAGVTIVGSVFSIAALWGLTATSAGTSAPLAVIGTAYAANTIANSFSDFYNCWWGDVDQVGEVNYLKTGMEDLGETVGGLLGFEDLGAELGDGIYAIGAMLSIAANADVLLGTINKTPALLDNLKLAYSKGEIPEFLNGLWEIANTSNLSEIKANYTSLVELLPEMGVVTEWASIIGKITSEAKDFAEILEDCNVHLPTFDTAFDLKSLII